jgi:hypothetical protein
MNAADSCDGEVDWTNIEVDKEDPHRATVSYKMLNSLRWIIWFTPGQRRLYSDKSVTFRATGTPPYLAILEGFLTVKNVSKNVRR